MEGSGNGFSIIFCFNPVISFVVVLGGSGLLQRVFLFFQKRSEKDRFVFNGKRVLTKLTESKEGDLCATWQPEWIEIGMFTKRTKKIKLKVSSAIKESSPVYSLDKSL